jgi:uncharacterized protein (DUF885 family)
MYAFAVRTSTTTTLTPDEIYAIGVREVARIRGEIDRLLRDGAMPLSVLESKMDRWIVGRR